MRTASLQVRTTLIGVLVLAIGLSAANVTVFTVMRSQLLSDLDQVLADRGGLVQELAQEEPVEELVEVLRRVGIPGRLILSNGEAIEIAPAIPRVAAGLPPADAGQPARVRDRTIELADGTVVVVEVSRTGTDAALRRLVALQVGSGVLALAVAFVLLTRGVRVALAPLDAVIALARRLAAGQSGERLRPERVDTELGRLAQAFDELLDAQQAALERARASDDRSRQFLADAAHQLRTPIAAAQATAEAASRSQSEAQRQRLLATLVRETSRSGRLVDDLLQIAHLDRGEPRPATLFDLGQVVKEEASRIADLASHRTIELDVPDWPVIVAGDPEAVRQAVGNLLDNAGRHARHCVLMTLHVHNGWVEVRVRDDGGGLPAGTAERVFDRFVSLDGHGGSGLGLAITRAVARTHGGDVLYLDDAFVIRLPHPVHPFQHEQGTTGQPLVGKVLTPGVLGRPPGP